MVSENLAKNQILVRRFLCKFNWLCQFYHQVRALKEHHYLICEQVFYLELYHLNDAFDSVKDIMEMPSSKEFVMDFGLSMVSTLLPQPIFGLHYS